MSMQDTLSDMLVRIRNAQMRGHSQAVMPSSRLKAAVAKVLADEGYLKDCKVDGDGANKPELTLTLKYFNGAGVIREMARVSRPGLRHYVSADKLPQIQGGLGIAILSTNQGVMTDKAARRANLGGEVLCTVF